MSIAATAGVLACLPFYLILFSVQAINIFYNLHFAAANMKCIQCIVQFIQKLHETYPYVGVNCNAVQALVSRNTFLRKAYFMINKIPHFTIF